MASTPSANVGINLTSACPDVSNAASQLNPTIVIPTDGSAFRFPFINGASGAGKIQSMFVAAESVTSGTPLVVNLTSGIVDPARNSVTFGKVLGLIVVNRSVTPGNDLHVGAAASNPWFTFLDSGTSYLVVPAGAVVGGVNEYGMAMIMAPNGMTVTPVTNINLAFNAAAGTVPFDLWVIGQ